MLRRRLLKRSRLLLKLIKVLPKHQHQLKPRMSKTMELIKKCQKRHLRPQMPLKLIKNQQKIKLRLQKLNSQPKIKLRLQWLQRLQKLINSQPKIKLRLQWLQRLQKLLMTMISLRRSRPRKSAKKRSSRKRKRRRRMRARRIQIEIVKRRAVDDRIHQRKLIRRLMIPGGLRKVGQEVKDLAGMEWLKGQREVVKVVVVVDKDLEDMEWPIGQREVDQKEDPEELEELL